MKHITNKNKKQRLWTKLNPKSRIKFNLANPKMDI